MGMEYRGEAEIHDPSEWWQIPSEVFVGSAYREWKDRWDHIFRGPDIDTTGEDFDMPENPRAKKRPELKNRPLHDERAMPPTTTDTAREELERRTTPELHPINLDPYPASVDEVADVIASYVLQLDQSGAARGLIDKVHERIGKHIEHMEAMEGERAAIARDATDPEDIF